MPRPVRPESANAWGLRLAPALAALWLLTFAPSFARGQYTDAVCGPPIEMGPDFIETPAPQSPAGPFPMQPSSRTAPSVKAIPEATEPASTQGGREPHDPEPASDDDEKQRELDGGFKWRDATDQALLFLGIQHGYALTQPKTRRDLAGPFFRDYFRSVKSLSKWEDGGRFFTNYVAHPLQGALLGHVWVQNDPKGRSVRFGRSKAYWHSRLKAFAWSTAWSTQFEIGPISQASLGNVGLQGKQTWVDIVVTPTGGAAWLVAEDALDRFLIRRIEARTNKWLLRAAARMLLNPTRSSANLLRFEKPWRRDR